jgi:hypothetical protein
MFKANTMLVVTASNKHNEELFIKFNILDADIADRWIDVVKRNKETSNTLRQNYRKILSQEERLENFDEFRNNILAINSMYDRQLDDIVSLEFLQANQDVLNDLHEEYEIYGDRLKEIKDMGHFNHPDDRPDLYNAVWPGRKQNFDVHERFLRLNEQIHNFEVVFRTWNNPHNGLCTCLVDYMPAGIHEPLKPEDYFLFESDLRWGWVYLGYNTLGKHWSSIMNENDIEVVRRDAVRPQARFAAEFYMNFGKSATGYYSKLKFYNWWLANNISEITDPNLKLADLALGYIPVAKINSYSLDRNEWISIPNGTGIKDEINWNVNVWSKFNKITNVEIITD